MSAAPQFAKQWLLATNGDLLNMDFVVRIYIGPQGKTLADMSIGGGAAVEIANPTTILDMRKLLPINAGAPA